MAVLDEFKELSPSVFYELANRKLLEDGIQIFLSQKISSISKINARTLEFEVFDRDVHYASLYVEKGKIAYSCSCRGLNETICSHAIGSCASLFAVLFVHCFLIPQTKGRQLGFCRADQCLIGSNRL